MLPKYKIPFPIPDEALVRFYAFVRTGLSTDECWEWQGGTHPYGSFWFKGRAYTAHRMAYAMHYGIDPFESLALHRCDNPPCVNPYHLFLGDYLVNNRDRQAKGRGCPKERHHVHLNPYRGTRNGRARLTDDQVREIRSLLGDGRSKKSVAERFGISRWCILQISRNKFWSHVQ